MSIINFDYIKNHLKQTYPDLTFTQEEKPTGTKPAVSIAEIIYGNGLDSIVTLSDPYSVGIQTFNKKGEMVGRAYVDGDDIGASTESFIQRLDLDLQHFSQKTPEEAAQLSELILIR